MDRLDLSPRARELPREYSKQESRASRGASATGSSATAKPGSAVSLPPPERPTGTPPKTPQPPPFSPAPPPPATPRAPALQRLAQLAGLAKASGRVFKPLGAFIAVGVSSQAAAQAAVEGASVSEQIGAFGRAGTNYLMWPLKPYDQEKP